MFESKIIKYEYVRYNHGHNLNNLSSILIMQLEIDKIK